MEKKHIKEEGFSSQSSLIPDRASWDSPLEFILSCIGYAIGLGNVWRFPYLCYRRGGGAFLIPYAIMLFLLGLPIFFLELAIGQFSGMGPSAAFKSISPLFHGVGYCTLVVITYVTIYYMVICGWTIFYLFASFSSELGWGSCQNDFNTQSCYSGLEELNCAEKNNGSALDTIFWNKTCYPVAEICQNFQLNFSSLSACINITSNQEIPINKLISRVYASQEYFEEYVLGINGATWYNFGYPRWQLVFCLLLAWIIAYGCVMKGVQSAGKAVYFTALFPYVVLFILLIRGLTLPGSLIGIEFYMKPDWSLLTEPGVWGDAASQVFYSFGIGCGSLITLASYNSLTNNCYRDALVVTAANAFTSILAGFCIFSVLGFLAQNLHLPVSEVATSGPGLAFVAYPEAVLRMPFPQLWSALFFFMLFILGLGSQFAGIEAINTTIIDHWPYLRNHQSKVTLGTCGMCFLLAIPMCCNGGIYLFTLMDWNTASWAILLIGVAEVGSIAWVYGCSRFLDDLRLMNIKLSKYARMYWWSVLVFFAPALAFGVFLFLMATYTPATFDDYIFPRWANGIGWCISLSTLVPMPVFLLYELFYNKIKLGDLLKTSNEWGPSEMKLAECQKKANRIGVNDVKKYGTMNSAGS